MDDRCVYQSDAWAVYAIIRSLDLNHMSGRKAAPRLAVPKQRYFKGKAPKGSNAVDSESDEEQTEVAVPEDAVGIASYEAEEDGNIALLPSKRVIQNARPVKVALGNVEVSGEGKVIVGGQLESGKTLVEQSMPFVENWTSLISFLI